MKNHIHQKFITAIAFIGVALCAAITSPAQTVITNASGGATTITNPIANNPLAATISLTNLAASVPAGIVKVATDGYGVFKNFSLTNPISIGVFGLQNGSGKYGAGLEANIINAASPVSAGFAVAGVQTETKNAAGNTSTEWNFYDATINLSVSQIENVPILNIPLILRIFSGPFASLNGGVLIGEQSGASGDLAFDIVPPKKPTDYGVNLDLGGGVVNCAGAAAAGLQPVMPMAHINLTFVF